MCACMLVFRVVKKRKKPVGPSREQDSSKANKETVD